MLGLAMLPGAVRRTLNLAWCAVPPLFFVALWWRGLESWFQQDDFVWLQLRQRVDGLQSLVKLFLPTGHGTFRPFSERGFFLLFSLLFGVDPLPFHIAVYLTACADLLLLAWIVRRLSGSRLAAFWAPVLWVANANLLESLAWTSAYNQILCGFFLLLEFFFLLRLIETGRLRYHVLQWCVFLVGFGVMETNLVYPALAGVYTLLCAPRYFRRIVPMFGVSVVFLALHMKYAPKQASGLMYAMHFDRSMPHTLAAYWANALRPANLYKLTGLPPWLGDAGLLLLSVALAGYVAWSAWRRRWLPVVCLSWFLFPLVPVLPLRDHVTTYYLTLPLLGVAMTGACALAEAWRAGGSGRVVASGLLLLYLVIWTPATIAAEDWWYGQGEAVERLVSGVEAARALHPGQAILLTGIDDELYWGAVYYGAFAAVGVQDVFVAPECLPRIRPMTGARDATEFVLPRELIARALAQDRLVVYAAGGPKLRNITLEYQAGIPAGAEARVPRRVDVSNPLNAWLLGPTWYPIEGTFRWMPRTASVTIGGPQSAAEKLRISGYCPATHLRQGPIRLTVAADGKPLPAVVIARPDAAFELDFALPPETVGKPSIRLDLSVDRTTPGDHARPLGLVFAVFEIR